jgi:hypothetical protein
MFNYRKISASAAGIMLVVFIAGCSGIMVSQDYTSTQRFPELKTFAWKTDKQEKTGDIRVDSPFIDQRIRNAVEKTMVSKGFTRTAESPDIYLMYHYTLRTKLTSTPSGPTIGFGFGTVSRHSAMGFSTETGSIDQYEEGQLVIDFIDGKTRSSIWRGISSTRVASGMTPEETTDLFDAMVEKNLEQFPPESKK